MLLEKLETLLEMPLDIRAASSSLVFKFISVEQIPGDNLKNELFICLLLYIVLHIQYVLVIIQNIKRYKCIFR